VQARGHGLNYGSHWVPHCVLELEGLRRAHPARASCRAACAPRLNGPQGGDLLRRRQLRRARPPASLTPAPAGPRRGSGGSSAHPPAHTEAGNVARAQPARPLRGGGAGTAGSRGLRRTRAGGATEARGGAVLQLAACGGDRGVAA